MLGPSAKPPQCISPIPYWLTGRFDGFKLQLTWTFRYTYSQGRSSSFDSGHSSSLRRWPVTTASSPVSLGSLVDSARALDDSVSSRFFVSSGPSDWTGGWCIWPGDMSRASALECADRLRRHSTSIACAPTHTISPLIDASPRAHAFSSSTCTSPRSLDNRSHRRPGFVFYRVVVRHLARTSSMSCHLPLDGDVSACFVTSAYIRNGFPSFGFIFPPGLFDLWVQASQAWDHIKGICSARFFQAHAKTMWFQRLST